MSYAATRCDETGPGVSWEPASKKLAGRRAGFQLLAMFLAALN